MICGSSCLDLARRCCRRLKHGPTWPRPARLRQARERRTYVLAFERDGSFCVEDVPPGVYELKIRLTKTDQRQHHHEERRQECDRREDHAAAPHQFKAPVLPGGLRRFREPVLPT